jgi:hypothetical protein
VVITSGSPGDGLVLRRHFEGDEDWLEIVHAEPQALFAGVHLRSIRQGREALGVSLSEAGVGGVLRIEARNRTVVYHLVAQKDDGVFVGEWPD